MKEIDGMATPNRRLIPIFLTVLLATLSGCQGLHQHAAAPPPGPASDVSSVTASPSGANGATADGPAGPGAEPPKQAGGMLLKTGGLFLGQGLGRNLLRTQGDNEWGF
jgi:hypothetical protein